jgi:hypothetical protein
MNLGLSRIYHTRRFPLFSRAKEIHRYAYGVFGTNPPGELMTSGLPKLVRDQEKCAKPHKGDSLFAQQARRIDRQRALRRNPSRHQAQQRHR